MNWISATGFSPCAAMPMDMPAIRPSASGVSCTRSAPKRSCRPTVARNTPPLTPTSSPSTTTSGSSASARASARLITSTRVTRGMRARECSVRLARAVAAGSFALRDELRRRMGEQVLEHVLGAHAAAVLVAVHCLVDAGGALRPERGLVCLAPPALGFEKAARADQWLELPGRLELRCGAVAAGVVGRGVVAEAVGDGFHHHGTCAAARPRQCFLHHLAHANHVVAVDLDAGHAIAQALLRKGPGGGLCRSGHRDCPAVV